MKLNVRKGIFETNSSSTHSLTIVSKEEFEKFKKGELIFNKWDDKLIEVTEKIKKNLLLAENGDDYEEDFDEDEYESYENLGGDQFETFEEDYKTKSGDEIVAFGFHGRDG